MKLSATEDVLAGTLRVEELGYDCTVADFAKILEIR